MVHPRPGGVRGWVAMMVMGDLRFFVVFDHVLCNEPQIRLLRQSTNAKYI